MNIEYSPECIKKLKKLDHKIRKSFKEKILQFGKNPYHPVLRNHSLQGSYKGYRSINITGDWRAIYLEITRNGNMIAYFITIGTHSQLYR